VSEKTCVCCEGKNFTFSARTKSGDYYRCNFCGSLFQLAALAGSESLQKKFEEEQFKFYGEDSVMLAKSFSFLQSAATAKRLRVLQNYIDRGRFIEVGPGDGSVMSHLNNNGYQIDAIEHSEIFAKSTSERTGLKVMHGDFNSYVTANQYDGYMSFHVIEHVPDVVSHLKKAAAITRPGGLALIATPHAASLEHKLCGEYAPNFSSAHLQLFSKKGLRLALEKSGWDVVEMQTPEYAVSWLRWGTALRRRYSRKKEKSVERGAYATSLSDRWFKAIKLFAAFTAPFRKVQELLGLGNELFVVARRRPD
jgi:2-polyprenyl-3-methyl-5-hydroxy-6-metoxy-1,4-benzoquinol methylase